MSRGYDVLICIAYENYKGIIRCWIGGLLWVSTRVGDASCCIILDWMRGTETGDCGLGMVLVVGYGEAVGFAGCVDSVCFIEWA